MSGSHQHAGSPVGAPGRFGDAVCPGNNPAPAVQFMKTYSRLKRVIRGIISIADGSECILSKDTRSCVNLDACKKESEPVSLLNQFLMRSVVPRNISSRIF